MRFSVKSVSTGKLYFAIRSGSIQSPYNLTDLSKIHPIVRFWPWNIPIHPTDPISGGRAVKPAVQKAHNKWSVQSLALFEKIAAACDEPARNWDFGQKISIFQSNLLHRALIQNRPKTVKNIDFSNRTRFSENFSLAAHKLSPWGVQNTDVWHGGP